MKSKYRDTFLTFGITAVLIMISTFDMDYQEFWVNLKGTGVYLPLILLLRLPVYLVSTVSWYITICSGGRLGFSSVRLYGFAVTGFALSYMTPVGLMGGEPHHITELKPHIGVERAISLVILHVTICIFSHFCFWLGSALLYPYLYSAGWTMGTILDVATVLYLLVVMLFVRGYQHGMAVAFVRSGSHLPFLKKEVVCLADPHQEQLENIDKQIALLHQQKEGAFYAALFLEYTACVVGRLEIWLTLNVLTRSASFANCCLITAFSSLLTSPLFFLPIQLGGREGGFALVVDRLSLSGAYEVCTALIIRVCETAWIVIGLALMKVGNRR